MKSSLIFVLISLTTNSLLATDSLFSFFNERPLGVQSSVAENQYGKIIEGAQITVFNIPLSTFEEIDEVGKRRGVILHGRKKLGELDDLFVKFTDLLTRQCGASEKFLVPNFEDATERETTMLAWRNDKSILLLSKTSDPSSQSIDIRHYEKSFFDDTLGADTKQHMDQELPKHAGTLPAQPFLKEIPYSAAKESSDSTSDYSEKNYNWLILAGVLVLVGVFVLILKIRK
jgi:hypothetical protein